MNSSETILELDRIFTSGKTAGCLDFLIEQFRADKNFALLFETRLMRTRMELGLPLIQSDLASPIPPELRAGYDEGIVTAAEEAGGLFLEEGNIPRAWPYFRAIGNSAPVVGAIDRFRISEINADQVNAVIAIAFEEALHPSKGLELILQLHGMCRAITTFGMAGVQQDREKCIALLVRGVYAEVVDRMTRAIESQEGWPPEHGNLTGLMKDRDYLFGEYDCYVDNSHLYSLLPYIPEVTTEDTLALYNELCEYGRKLSPQFQMRGDPPFEDPYVDYGYYLQALQGIRVEDALAHFRTKLSSTGAAEVMVNLLVRLHRIKDALAVSLEYLDGQPNSAVQLCYSAADFEQLKTLAAARGDLLSYVAAISKSSGDSL